MDNLKCQEMYNKYNEENKKNIKILDQQVCAGHTEGKIDGCQVSWAILVKKVLIDEYLFAPCFFCPLFFLFTLVIDSSLHMSGFELRIPGVGSNCNQMCFNHCPYLPSLMKILKCE